MTLPPLLEYDPERISIIEPRGPRVTRPDLPRRAVLTFFADILAELVAEGRLEEVGYQRSELGRHPLYLYRPGGEGGPELLVAHAGLGAPLSVGLAEELIAMGVNQIIACGSCGVLQPEIAAGHPVVLTAAVRDEGTSYHYLPPAREALPHPRAVAALEAACQQMGIAYRLGKAWTTDAFYRETPARRAARLAEGCEVVEMEAAAFFALAEFRAIVFGQIVYGGDLVVPEGWDHRDFHKRAGDRRLMFELAVDACLRL